MKKRIILIFIIMLLLPTKAWAHSGKTDANSGHYDSSTGEYHYHHGYPAHSHSGGCPYDYDDQTDHSSSQNQNSNKKFETFSEYLKRQKENNASKDTSSTQEKEDTTSSDDENDKQIERETKNNQQNNKVASYINEIFFLSIAFVGLMVLIIFSIMGFKNKKSKNDYVHTHKDLAIPEIENDLSKLKKRSIDIESYHSSRTDTLFFKDQLKMDYANFELSTEYKKSIEKMIEKGHYKTAVLMLIDLGIYKDYFYDMLDMNISKEDLKEYADYKAFINME